VVAQTDYTDTQDEESGVVTIGRGRAQSTQVGNIGNQLQLLSKNDQANNTPQNGPQSSLLRNISRLSDFPPAKIGGGDLQSPPIVTRRRLGSMSSVGSIDNQSNHMGGTRDAFIHSPSLLLEEFGQFGAENSMDNQDGGDISMDIAKFRRLSQGHIPSFEDRDSRGW
jgi:hypothetical protein